MFYKANLWHALWTKISVRLGLILVFSAIPTIAEGGFILGGVFFDDDNAFVDTAVAFGTDGNQFDLVRASTLEQAVIGTNLDNWVVARCPFRKSLASPGGVFRRKSLSGNTPKWRRIYETVI